MSDTIPRKELLRIGAIACLFNLPRLALHISPDGTFDTGDDAHERIMAALILSPVDGTNIDDDASDTVLARKEVENWMVEEGREVARRGYSSDRYPLYQGAIGDFPVSWVYSSNLAGWNHVDGTIPWSLNDEMRRYAKGPRWNNNSCAVDCLLTAALLMNAGRTRADQLTGAGMKALSEPAKLTLRVIRQPWGSLTRSEIYNLRNEVANSVEEYSMENFKKGTRINVVDLFEAMFRGLPQLSYTTVRRYTCGDGNGSKDTYERTRGTKQIMSRENLGFHEITPTMAMSQKNVRDLEKGLTIPIQDLINQLLSRSPLDSGAESETVQDCCSRLECPGVMKQTMILDRLPPVLVLGHGWDGRFKAEEKRSKLQGRFRALRLKWQHINGSRYTSVYEPLGFVFLLSASHYVLNWRLTTVYGTQRYIQYDGLMNNGVFRGISNLESRYNNGTTSASLSFYQIKDIITGWDEDAE